ncbi:Serine/threonine-protein kinase PknD [Halomonas sp. THAF5a]|uniref:protein kinase domain-containing protein n=1 Tax=Halomonas sp. THAF5a TaxID=2587844 RepID=UPI0012682946|nr:protein kinase [Halomonas sp. THAF5a]QFU01023.1 Serine/threonine-protein kinase PknD [Halomonas sp. THAF5a]
MRSYEHCGFEHERKAFARLEQKVPEREGLELYPSVYIPDNSRNVYHECDLLVIAESFAAVVELKHWQGEIDIGHNVWRRNGTAIRDPHEVNLPKAKVFKSLLEQTLPAARIPFVQSIVVLTADNASVSGAHAAFDIIKLLDETKGKIGDHLTFDGIDELAKYLRERIKRDFAAGRQQVSPQDFGKLKKKLDERFVDGLRRKDFSDQISGFKIRQEIEHTARFVSYLAEANPSRGDMLYRLRVFGSASIDPAVQARQFRSLDALERLSPHPHIRPTHRHPNERNLVVEVCPWGDVQTLDQVLESGTTLSHEFTVRVVRDLAFALAHVHADATLIHRNLTPRSVIVGRDDHVELTDFDLAFDAGADYTVISDDLTKLERHYLAPEALAGKFDFASDIFSLGRLFQDLLDAGDLDEASAEELCALAETMCSLEPAERPTAEAVAHQLSEYLGEQTSTAMPATEPQAPKEPEVGDTYDTWELLRELGHGGSSRVFYAESHRFPAALKIFHADVPRDRCLAERDFLHYTKNPFIAGFHSFTQWAGHYWCIAQEYAEGESLRTLISQHYRPDAGLFAEVARQMLTALEALHTPLASVGEEDGPGKVIHNDVTPGNIVLNLDRRVAKLIDFGMASTPGLTVIGGTPGYVAQDLVNKDGYRAVPQGDLYALAMTLVEWATGQRPENAEAVPPLFANEVETTVSEQVAAVLRCALGPSDARFTSARVMRQALDEALAEPEAVVAEQTPVDDELKVPVAEIAPERPASAMGVSDVQVFVEYLNTIHNLSADNRHALAEAQATSRYFSELHVELKLTKSIVNIFSREEDAVVMLTGHAGDGKSTVAVELLKRARGLPAGTPLPQAPDEVELVQLYGRPLAIVKDMSELPASERLEKLRDAITGAGNALIVSNTGPLLSAFSDYFSQLKAKEEVEQKVLHRLDQPLHNGELGDNNCLPESGGKKVYIANLSMLSNVDTAVEFLDKLVAHPIWDECAACNAAPTCPIKLNVELLRESGQVAQERVRFVYERMTAYGRRMTMRQLTAHLSFSLTGGLSCQDVRTSTTGERPLSLFSESFFGHVGPLTEQAVDALFCLKQMADLHFGANSNPKFDQLVYEGRLGEALELPSRVERNVLRWQKEARDPAGGEARRRLRRLVYMLGQPRSSYGEFKSVLIDDFLHSPMLRTLGDWVNQGSVDTGLAKRKFIKKTLGVLMEEYIGCMVPGTALERLFITLRRPDESLFQPVQIVLKTIPVDEFELTFDRERALPVLVHNSARLGLTLPLLDYIVSRSRGEITGELDAIHRASLDQFRGALLGTGHAHQDVITVLQIDADGEVMTHKFSANSDGQRLVYQ